MWSRLREVNTPRGAANQTLAIVGKAKRLQQVSHAVARVLATKSHHSGEGLVVAAG